MTSKEWADEIIGHLKRVQQTSKEILASTVQGVAPIAQGPGAVKAGALDPHAVAEALAEALKADNSTTQAISIRASNLQQKYPQRAY